MIGHLTEWYGARSRREQRLLQLMAAILVPLLAWLLLVRPLGNAYDAAHRRQLQALDRNGRVKALAAFPAAKVPAAVPDLVLFLSDGARQRGIVAEGRATSEPGSAEISISSSPAPTSLEWLRSLEADGYRVSEARVTPTGGGTVEVTATVSGRAQ